MNQFSSQFLKIKTFQNESTFVPFALCNTRDVLDTNRVPCFIGTLMLQSGACLTCVFCFISGGCGGSLTTTSGTFSSPSYPLPYHPSAECYWNIRTNQGSQLFLSFSDFHLEASTTCSFDYLAVSVSLGSRQRGRKRRKGNRSH